ncbi:MAG: ATP-binding cassette domain-containing protein [Planctomycetota bacterium]|nr:ATP-binding cassette domain-containing protein [Planctomycetota bacterium]
MQPRLPIAKALGKPLLEVKNLSVHFPFYHGSWFRRKRAVVKAVDGVSFTVHEGETLGLVGESGCGKSTTARAVLNLIRPTAGEVSWEGERIEGLSEQRMRPFRQQMQMIFQDPFASLNPRMTVGEIVSEPMRIFRLHDSRRRKLEVVRILDMVGLNPRFLNRYPHEFSGGQRQRIGIARALAVNPRLIICDEPVSALDVSIQAQVVNLLMDLQRQLKLSYVFIAHDLAVVRQISDRIGVMYYGKLVELADAETLYIDPQHLYTKALLSAIPIPDPAVERQRKRLILTDELAALARQ